MVSDSPGESEQPAPSAAASVAATVDLYLHVMVCLPHQLGRGSGKRKWSPRKVMSSDLYDGEI